MKAQLKNWLIPTLLFVILVFASHLKGYAQFSIFLDFKKEGKKDTLYNKVVEELTQRTTYLLIKPDFEDSKSIVQKAADQFWKIGQLRVITYQDYVEYLEEHPNEFHGRIDITGTVTDVTMNSRTGGGYTTAHYYIQYSLIAGIIPTEDAYTKAYIKLYNKKGQEPPVVREEFYLAQYELYPGMEIISGIVNHFTPNKRPFHASETFKPEQHLLDVLYNGTFYNYQPGFLINYLKLLNSYLAEGKEKGMFENIEKESLSVLKDNVLLIPDYTLEKFNPRKGFQGEKFEVEELLNEYQYPYQIISSEDLNKKIISTKEDFYYYTFTRGATNAFHTVTNGLTGEVIYSRYDALTYNVKPKDFSVLFKQIK